MAHTTEEQRNLDLVLEMYREVLIKMDASKVDRYISPDYLQHSSLAPPGRDALKQFLQMIRKESPMRAPTSSGHSSTATTWCAMCT